MSAAIAMQTSHVKGLYLDVLMDMVGVIQIEPVLGIASFLASNAGMGGNHNRSEFIGFFGARQKIAHALASCLTTSMAARAALRVCVFIVEIVA